MRCLYEVLEIERDADDATIKSSYRKAALRWHPDKNKGNAEAEERFKEVQNAYEVLSDKHERAWYDSHRQDILRGGSRHQAGATSTVPTGQAPDDEVDLFPYFSSTCYSGYKDGSMGFYGVYESIFAQLSKQEKEYASASDEGLQAQDLSGFGTSQSEWSKVAAFYSAWSSFATCKSFAWADQYHPGSAPNRKVRRLMEDENKKARRAKRKEFQDTVRELVSFVKKRDKRVAAHQAEEAKRRLEKEAAESIRRDEERKARLQRAREYEEAQWAQMDEADEQGSSEDVEIAQNNLYCMACDKTFRSENAMANHERSKKHLEKVEILRAVLAEEEQELAHENEAEEESDSNDEMDVPASNANGGQVQLQEAASDLHELREAPGNAPHDSDENTADSSGSDSSEAAQDFEHSSINGDSVPQNGRISEDDIDQDDNDDDQQEDYDSESDMLAALLKIQQGKASTSNGKKKNHRKADSKPISPKEVFRDSTEGPEDHTTISTPTTEAVSPDEEDNSMLPGKDKKKRRRRAKAATGQSVQESSASEAQIALPGKGAKHKEARKKKETGPAPVFLDNETSQTTCSVCHAEFSSRSRLFKHIKDSGHVALKA